jgi:hypothetical protein
MRHMVLALSLLAAPLHASPLAGQGPDAEAVGRLPRFEAWPALAAADPHLAEEPQYRPTHWKRGALIGAAVGVVIVVLGVATCDPDGGGDCPDWGRAALAFGTATGLGALIGAFFPKPSAASEP